MIQNDGEPLDANESSTVGMKTKYYRLLGLLFTTPSPEVHLSSHDTDTHPYS